MNESIEELLAKAETRSEVLGLALGRASSCWDNLAGAGVFQSDEAKATLEACEARLRELDQPLLGLATTAELINELAARWKMLQYSITEDVQKFLNYRTVDA